MLRPSLLICFLCAFVSTVLAQTAPGLLLPYSTSRGGGVSHVLVQGGYLYVAEGSSLVVYDMRSPLYARSFECRFGSAITDMKLSHGALYIAANHEGLSKWDITNPIKPALLAEYKLSDFETAFQTIDFAGDSVILAANSCVMRLREPSSQANFRGVANFEKLDRFAVQMEGRGIVSAGVCFGNYYAAALTGKEKGIGQGIHTYRMQPEARLNFHHYDSAAPSQLLLFAAAKRILVMGGPTFALQSHFFGLNVSDPAHPALSFCDTVWGNWAEADLGAGILIGDTLCLPFKGHFQESCAGYDAGVALYNVSNPAQPRWLGQIPFLEKPLALAYQGEKLHVALGESGLVSCDLSQLKTGWNCKELPTIGQIRRNGGFCRGADALGDKLLTADGAAGFTMHLIQERKTIAMRNFNLLGSIDQVRMLSDGLHAAAWVHAPKGDSLIVVRLDDSKVVGSLSGPFGTKRVLAWKDRLVVARDDHRGFDLINLQTPSQPKKEQTVLLNFNDFALDELGRLIVSTTHNVRIFDLSGTTLVDLITLAKWGEGFGAVAAEAGNFYAVSEKRGLIRFRLSKDRAGKYSLVEELVWKVPQTAPLCMSVAGKYIFLGYDAFGVYMLDRLSFETKGYFRSGLDFKARPHEGLQDVFCRGGKVFVVEYYGQVSILDAIGAQE